VYIPSDVLSALDIKDGDDVDFFKFSGKSFLFAKKADIVDLLTKLQGQNVQVVQAAVQANVPKQPAAGSVEVNAKELAILQKLDTLRYNDRTKDKVDAMLSAEERQTLQGLVRKKFIDLFKKPGDQEYKYSITKNIYNMFLYGKRPRAASPVAPVQRPAVAVQPPAGVYKAAEPSKSKPWEQKLGSGSAYTSLLESKGFVVLQNEADASNLSAAMEESIRHGLVLGTRAFNKKFYIATRSYINKNTPTLMGALGEKGRSVEELSKETGIEEDGIRAILYIMSESGEVTEQRRDIFKIA
jgi:bifunctional DNA-binding transcriptional regulator/antitoxin component of YhaV-PrlF toxin-antitoxin module